MVRHAHRAQPAAQSATVLKPAFSVMHSSTSGSSRRKENVSAIQQRAGTKTQQTVVARMNAFAPMTG